jgi:zinc protease
LKTFGAWAGAKPAHSRHPYTDARLALRGAKVLIVARPGLNQAQVRLGFQAPLMGSPDHYPLTVANALVGEYFNIRLNALIRDKLGLTYAITSAFSYSSELAAFTVATSTRNETSGDLIVKVLEVLDGVRRGPLPAAEVETAKEYLRGGFPLTTATLQAVASRWLTGYFFDLGPNYLGEYLPRIAAVKPEDVLKASAKHIRPDRAVIVISGEPGPIAASLRKAGLTSFKQVGAKDLM